MNTLINFNKAKIKFLSYGGVSGGVLCILLALGSTTFAQQKFNVQSGAKTEFYNTFEAALQQAQAGDTIYLPSGLASSQQPIVIDKKLVIVGVGGELSSTIMPTRIEQNITFTENASGSLLTGCRIINSNIDIGANAAVQNISLIRNYIISSEVLDINIFEGSSTIFIRENFIHSSISSSQTNTIRIISNPATTTNPPTQCFIENNIFYTSGIYGGTISCVLIGIITDSYILNNVFRHQNAGSTTSIRLGGLSFSTVQNNYFMNLNASDLGNNNIYNNNATAQVNTITFPNGTNTGSNNLFNQSWANTFGGTDPLSPASYQLRIDSPCVGEGIDGTDIGVFGGIAPFKEGMKPFNPYIQTYYINSQSNMGGFLPVKLEVEAQDR